MRLQLLLLLLFSSMIGSVKVIFHNRYWKQHIANVLQHVEHGKVCPEGRHLDKDSICRRKIPL